MSDEQLAEIHADTKRMGHAERIIYWDKRQAAKAVAEGGALVAAPDVVFCPNDRAHGVLTINGSGSMLMCGARKGGAFCTGAVPVSL